MQQSLFDEFSHLPYSITPTYVEYKQGNNLEKFIEPHPLTAASHIINSIHKTSEPLVFVVHSESMCSGKTQTCIEVAEGLGVSNFLTFQPRAGVRFGIEQEVHIMSRKGLKLPSVTIEDNNLFSIVSYAEEHHKDPFITPYILIDEGMLFIAHANNPKEACKALEALRSQGFTVIINGIDYTFQEEPFTFMHHLLQQTLYLNSWKQLQLTTKCVFCQKTAKGSMRLKVLADNSYRIADYDDGQFQAGDNYYPVCCEEHPSCLNQPVNFSRVHISDILPVASIL